MTQTPFACLAAKSHRKNIPLVINGHACEHIIVENRDLLEGTVQKMRMTVTDSYFLSRDSRIYGTKDCALVKFRRSELLKRHSSDTEGKMEKRNRNYKKERPMAD